MTDSSSSAVIESVPPAPLVRGERAAHSDCAALPSPRAGPGGVRSLSVALVCLPFASHCRPSIQLGLLKAIADTAGHQATTFHFNLDFAAQLGPELYEALSQHRGVQLGEWLFSKAAFAGDAPPGAFLHDFTVAEQIGDDLRARGALAPELEAPGAVLDQLARIRLDTAPRFIDALADAVPWADFQVVGFTSTFQQNVASLALAKAIKARHPETILLFGGANFEGEMGLELTRAFDCVDYAISGEADNAFPAFLQALDAGTDPARVPGVVCCQNGLARIQPQRALLRELDQLPTPDYDEFFERAERLGLLAQAARRAVDLPFESARGCWWGEKHHCTFCGLNAMSMTFRTKSKDRILNELRDLTVKYRSFQFQVVDNILDMKLLNPLFEQLVEDRADYELFYEIKSNLSREQIRLLAVGGLTRLQPGIEALNTRILQFMRKGVTAIQNVNTLRWATYYGIGVSWNLLSGFPGETVGDYEQQLQLLTRIGHLPPPGGTGRIWMERFSPIYVDREAFPARFIKPEKSYAYVYPARVDLERAAYFFDYELEGTLPETEPVLKQTLAAVEAWQEAWRGPNRPTLTFRSAPGFTQIDDLRHPEAPGTYTLVRPLADLYLAANSRPRTVAALRRQLELPHPEEELESALDQLCEQGVMMRDGDFFLALALPATGGR